MTEPKEQIDKVEQIKDLLIEKCPSKTSCDPCDCNPTAGDNCWKEISQQIADLWKGYVKLADDQTKPRVPAFPDESSMGESITWTAQYVYQLAQKEMLKAGFRKVIL